MLVIRVRVTYARCRKSINESTMPNTMVPAKYTSVLAMVVR